MIKPKRNPFCSRCRNHGKSAQVKGHKRHCEYRDCQCEGCKLVECRQIVSASQIKLRRYQKQDEECGRRIEVSPPVLKRELSSDPATLIAKTLIGSSASKRLSAKQMHVSSPTSLSHADLHNPTVTQQLHHLSALQSESVARASSSELAAKLAGLPPPAIPATLGLDHSQHHHTLHQQNHHNHQHPLVSAAAHLYLNLNHHHHHQQQQHHHHQQQQQHNSTDNLNRHQHRNLPSPSTSNGVNGQVSLANNLPFGPAGSAALHLLDYPNPLLSHAAAAASLAAGHSSASLAAAFSPNNSGTNLSSPNGSRSVPSIATSSAMINGAASHSSAGATTPPNQPVTSIREKINLVDEIDRSYGSLAIYAWLKAEQFDHKKIRSLISQAKSSFDELLQANSAANSMFLPHLLPPFMHHPFLPHNHNPNPYHLLAGGGGTTNNTTTTTSTNNHLQVSPPTPTPATNSAAPTSTSTSL